MRFWGEASPARAYARRLESLCYLLAPLGFIGLCLQAFGPVMERSFRYWYDSIYLWIGVFLMGIGLMGFYMLSSRRALHPLVVALGWILSIVYNSLPFLLFIYLLLQSSAEGARFGVVILGLILLLVPAYVLVLSLQALRAVWTLDLSNHLVEKVDSSEKANEH